MKKLIKLLMPWMLTKMANWKKGYGKLLQIICSNHSKKFSRKFVKEQFETLIDKSFEEKIVYSLEVLGFSVTRTIFKTGVNEPFPEILILDDEILAVRIKNPSSEGGYLTDTGVLITSDQLTNREFKKCIGFSLFKVYEEFSTVKKRLKHLNVLSSLGIGNFSIVATATALSNILGLASSLFVMVVYDRVLPNQSSESLYALAAGVLIAIMFDIGLKSIRSSFLEHAATQTDHRIVEDIFEQYVESAKDNRTRSIGALSTIVRDFESYRDFISSATILGLIDLPFVFIFISVIYLIGGPLAIIPLVAVPLLIFGVLFVQPFLVKISNNLSKATQSRQSNLVEILNGLDAVRTNGAYSIMKGRFKQQSENYSVLSNKSKKVSGFTGGLINTVQQVSQVAIILYGFHLFVVQEITMGAIIATVILSGRSLAPLSKIAQTLSRANSSYASYQNLKSFLSENRVVRDQNGINLLSDSQIAISLSNVTLRLSEAGQPLFEQLSLNIKKGEKVAIIGKSGAGKTSLVRLLAGLSQPETGNIRLFENDIRAYERSDITEKMGIVFQDSWLFSGTLRENITLGDSELADDEILSVLSKCGLGFSDEASDTILEMGIEDRGSNLSGGQKQAICLARALVRQPKVVVFDEPTSAMDQLTEKTFVENFINNFSGVTAVLVTHKPNMLKICDRVIVMDQGAIKWDGPITDYLKLASQKAKNP